MQETTVFLKFTIILSIYFNTIFIHKKRFPGAVSRDCSWNHNFSCYLIHGRKQVLIWNIRFFSFPYTQSFCKLTETSRVKSSPSCHTVFTVMQVLPSNLWANVMARVYLLLWHLLELIKVSFFIILLIEKRLIPVCLAILWGPKHVCTASSCGQTSSSIKLVFSSVVTDLGRPEPFFLFVAPLSLKRFKSIFTKV